MEDNQYKDTDPRFTGVKPLKGLKGIGAESQEAAVKNDIEQSQKVWDKRRYSAGKYALVRPDNVPFDVTSKFDKTLGDVWGEFERGKDIGDLRAEQQTTAGVFLNSLINNIAIAGSTAILGTLGLVDGLIESAFTGENRIGDNWVTRAENDFQNWVDENVPVYRGSEYENKSTFAKLGTAIFWGDFIKNLGYTEGMLIPGMGAAGAAGKLAKAIGAGEKVTNWVTKLTGSLVGAMTEASTEAVSNSEDQKKYKLSILQDEYNEKMREAQASGDQDEMYRLYKEHEKALADIDEDALKTSDFIFWANTGLLMATNLIEFGGLFGKSFDSGRRTLTKNVKSFVQTPEGQIRRATEKDITKEGIKNLSFKGMSKGKEIARVTTKKTADAASEAFEEVSQGVIAHLPEIGTDYNKFNESVLNPEKKELVDNYMQGWFKSITDRLEDKETGVEALMGFLTGFLGAPTYVRGRGITWGNGVITEINNAAREGKISQKVATELNDIMEHISSDEKFLARYKGLIRNQSLEDLKNAALEVGDKVAYKDAESAQFISDVETFREAGQIDMFKKIFETVSELSDEEIDGIIKTTTDESGNGPFSKDGKADDIESVRNAIKAKADKYIKNIDRIVEDAQALENNPHLKADKLSADEFNTLLFLKEQGFNYTARLESMLGELAQEMKYGFYDQILEKVEKEVSGYEETVKENNEKQEKLRNYNSRQVENGAPIKDITAVRDYLLGKDAPLSKEDEELKSAVISGNYGQYASGRLEVLRPEDFDELASIVSKRRGEAVKAVTAIIDGFKNSSLNSIINNYQIHALGFAYLKNVIDENVLNDESVETLQNVQDLLTDIERVRANASYYKSEFNKLLKEYSNASKNRGFGSKIKEKAQEAVDKVKNRTKAKKVREQQEAAGEDTSNMTDEEVLQKDEQEKDTANVTQRDYETTKNKILEGIENEDDRNAANEYIDSLVEPILSKLNDESTQQEITDAYKEALAAILNHDNYNNLDLVIDRKKTNEIKDSVRKTADSRKNFEKQKTPEPQEENRRLFDTAPIIPNQGEQSDKGSDEVNKNNNDRQDEEEGTGSLNHLTNRIPAFPKALKNNPKYNSVPLNKIDEKTALSLGVPQWYINHFNFLNGAGAYDAIANLVGPMFEKAKGNKVPVKFMMIDADENMWEKDGKKIHVIYHVIDVTDNKEWIKAHDSQLYDYKGRKYQIIGQHTDDEGTPGVSELNNKLYKESEGKFENGKWVSDETTFTTILYQGRLDKGKYSISSPESNISETLDRNNMSVDDFVLGVLVNEGGELKMNYVDEKGNIVKREVPKDYNASSGAFMLLPSANPSLFRDNALVIPYLKNYLKDNPDTEFTNLLIDSFTSLVEEAMKTNEEISEEDIRKHMSKLHQLVYMGNYKNEGGVRIKGFDKGDSVDVVIGLYAEGARKTDEKDERVFENTTLSIPKSANKEQVRDIVKNYVFGRFADLTESDALSIIKETTNSKGEKKVNKYPQFRIRIIAPKQYKTGTSITFAANALELKGNANTAYKKFLIDNNMLKTDLGSTIILDSGYALAVYDPKTGKFEDIEEHTKAPSPIKPEPQAPQGVDTAKKITEAKLSLRIHQLSGNIKGSFTVTANIENGNISITNAKGKDITSMFSPSYRNKLQTAIETNSAIPQSPIVYTLRDGKDLYIAYYNDNNELEVMDEDYNYIEDSAKKTEIKNKFNEYLKPKTPEKANEAVINAVDDPLAAGIVAGIEEIKEEKKEDLADDSEVSEEVKKEISKIMFENMLWYAKRKRLNPDMSEEEVFNLFKEDVKLRYKFTDAEFAYWEKLFKKSWAERGKKYNAGSAKANLEKELAWMGKAIPQARLRTRIVQGFVKMLSDPSGLYAGKFMNNAIELSENYATAGTAYHEAFHFVFNALLDENERQELLKNTRAMLGKDTSVVDAEEWLADRFADYAGKKENRIWNTSIGKALSKIFEWLKEMFSFSSRNRKNIMRTFKAIHGGDFANRPVIDSLAERGKDITNDDINIMMQSIVDKVLEQYPARQAYNLEGPTNKKVLIYYDTQTRSAAATEFNRRVAGLPVKVVTLTPAKVADLKAAKMNMKKGTVPENGMEHGLAIQYTAKEIKNAIGASKSRITIQDRLSEDELPMSLPTLQDTRRNQMADLVVEKSNGELTKADVADMDENSLETMLYCYI